MKNTSHPKLRTDEEVRLLSVKDQVYWLEAGFGGPVIRREIVLRLLAEYSQMRTTLEHIAKQPSGYRDAQKLAKAAIAKATQP